MMIYGGKGTLFIYFSAAGEEQENDGKSELSTVSYFRINKVGLTSKRIYLMFSRDSSPPRFTLNSRWSESHTESLT